MKIELDVKLMADLTRLENVINNHERPSIDARWEWRWCMNRNWPATILTQRLLTYRYRTTLARQGPSSDSGCCMRAAPRPFALLACALEGQCR